MGLAGSSENEEDFQNLAAATQKLLIARGFPADGIVALTDHATRESILQALKPAPGDTAADEFWLVLYGHSGTSIGGIPAFQVSGPRLTADDLKTALDAIPDKEFVMIGTSNSGPFLPLLQSPRRMVVSATAGEGQSDQPRYPDKWVDAFTENPKASFAWIAARASALVDQEYTNDGLAQTESAEMADPVSGTILEPPFGWRRMTRICRAHRTSISSRPTRAQSGSTALPRMRPAAFSQRQRPRRIPTTALR